MKVNMYKIRFAINIKGCLLLAFLVFMSCNKPEPDEPNKPTPTPDPVKKIEILINPTNIDNSACSDFKTNDRIGLYVVNYDGAIQCSLKENGNHVNNMCFTYNNVWKPDSPIYWKDETSNADFYLYYPYTTVLSTSAFPFAVKANQSSESAYRSSDMIIGVATNISPTDSPISIPVRHIMSSVNIKLQPGDGYTKESLSSANISVSIEQLQTQCGINLSTGDVTTKGFVASITPHKDGDVYKAIVVPQTVAETNLIKVNVDGRDFSFKKGLTFESGKSYTLVLSLDKTSNGINVNINPWTEDGIDHGGSAE